MLLRRSTNIVRTPIPRIDAPDEPRVPASVTPQTPPRAKRFTVAVNYQFISAPILAVPKRPAVVLARHVERHAYRFQTRVPQATTAPAPTLIRLPITITAERRPPTPPSPMFSLVPVEPVAPSPTRLPRSVVLTTASPRLEPPGATIARPVDEAPIQPHPKHIIGHAIPPTFRPGGATVIRVPLATPVVPQPRVPKPVIIAADSLRLLGSVHRQPIPRIDTPVPPSVFFPRHSIGQAESFRHPGSVSYQPIPRIDAPDEPKIPRSVIVQAVPRSVPFPIGAGAGIIVFQEVQVPVPKHPQMVLVPRHRREERVTHIIVGPLEPFPTPDEPRIPLSAVNQTEYVARPGSIVLQPRPPTPPPPQPRVPRNVIQQAVPIPIMVRGRPFVTWVPDPSAVGPEPEPVLDKLADPRIPTRRRRPRGWEPFDLSYYRTKYKAAERARILSAPIEVPDTGEEPPAVAAAKVEAREISVDIERLAIEEELREQALLQLANQRERERDIALLQAELLELRGLIAAARLRRRKINNEIAVLVAVLYLLD